MFLQTNIQRGHPPVSQSHMPLFYVKKLLTLWVSYPTLLCHLYSWSGGPDAQTIGLKLPCPYKNSSISLFSQSWSSGEIKEPTSCIEIDYPDL